MQDSAVRTVDRIAAILRTLSTRGVPGLHLGELADEAGLTKATAHRLLAALGSVGYVFQDQPSRRYRLGAAAAALGRSGLQHHVAGLVQPSLDRLAGTTGDTAFASIREGLSAVCVARAVGSYPIRTLTLEVGDRRPLGVGAGSLALLAGLSPRDAEIALRRGEPALAAFPGFGADMLAGLVARARREGFALNEGRVVPAMSAVGMAVRDPGGDAALALSLAAIKDRMAPERLPDLVAALRAEVRHLESLLAEHAALVERAVA